MGLTETRRHHPLNAVYETGEELFLRTCDSRETEVSELSLTGISYDRLVERHHDCTRKAESFKTTKRHLSAETLELIRLRGAARTAGNQELTPEHAKLSREEIKEHLKERSAESFAEVAEAGKSIRYARRDFAIRKTRMTSFRNPKGTTIASRRGVEKIIYDFYSDLFDSHVHLPPHHLREDGHIIPELFTRVTLSRTEKVLD
ncbi:hypothetical protein RB195_009238 [Necator americanus]|uniref:Uncharacterized protein n=1 Tax=Necator americanus TaxID=51031 RepID=A0ABR1CSF1_NECAM